MGDAEEKETLQRPFVNSEVLLTLKPYYGTVPVDHPDTTAPYPCLQCRRRCATLHQLLMHRQWHRRENECSICDKTFSTFDIFKSHVRKHYVDATKDYSVNNKIRENPVMCSYCEEKFTTLRDLHQHTRLYADNYKTCEHCDLYLPTCHRHCEPRSADHNAEHALRRYRLNALREKTFNSTLNLLGGNPKIHSSVATYNYHIKSDPALRPFQCDICSSRFGDRARLEQHLNDHYTEHSLLYSSTAHFPSKNRLSIKYNGSPAQSYSLSS